jgi:hypothetical protein
MSDIITGARARLSVQGTKVAYATGVTVREMVNYQPLEVLDNVQVEEHVPVGYDVSLTADMVRVLNKSVKQLGWFPKMGNDPKTHLTNILNMGEMTATIEDPISGNIIMQLEGVKMSERNITIQARSIVGKNVSFVAKRARDESDLV